jgi:CRP/FNR family transcriptional regulator, dissimilatory nitrate respiration regulator
LREWLSAAVSAGAIDRSLSASQVLFRAGDKTVGLYEILEGKLRLVRHDRSGREAILQSASVGDTLAEASLYASTYHCDAIATTEALVRLYPKALLLAELKREPKLAQAFTAMLAQQIMGLRTRLEGRNIHSARDRVRHFLAVNVGADGRTVALSGTLKDLAVDLGLTHEALYRTLSRMEADGEIKRADRAIKIGRAV